MIRKPRKMPKEHKNIDTMKPLLYTELGSKDDPCFGKHYSLKAPECQRCGDSEICAILSGQSILNQSIEQESKAPFKDIEEGDLIDKQNNKIRKFLENRASKKPSIYLSIEKALPLITKKLNLTDGHSGMVRQRIIKAAKDSKLIKLNKLETKYKYNNE